MKTIFNRMTIKNYILIFITLIAACCPNKSTMNSIKEKDVKSILQIDKVSINKELVTKGKFIELQFVGWKKTSAFH